MTTDALTTATAASQNSAHTTLGTSQGATQDNAQNNTQGTLRRLSAFTQTPEGGNPAGVWIGDQLPSEQEMQAIAAEVGFSETAFIAPSTGQKRTIRYYSPETEVAFCGHATIASGVALGESDGDNTYLLSTTVGEVPVTVKTEGSLKTAALTSIEPEYQPASESLLKQILEILGWQLHELDPSIPPANAYSGNWHFVIAAGSKQRLDNLDYDFDRLKQLMQAENLTTLQLIWRESDQVIHSRNPFPIGGVVEDPATGAAAAALGGYLREANLIQAPAHISVHQGVIMGRPSLLEVTIPTSGGITVAGTAVAI